MIDEQPDWVKATLDLPMLSAPGTDGHYCSGAVAVAGRLTENATGRALPEYAQEHLFGPLGIRRLDWRWNYTLGKENREYSQTHLRPRDMLKPGILYAMCCRPHGYVPLSTRAVRSTARITDISGGVPGSASPPRPVNSV